MNAVTKISSAVLKGKKPKSSFSDDMQKLTTSEIIELYTYTEAILETVREPLVILDKDLRVKTANKAFFDDFKMSKDETYGKYIYKLNGGEWNIPALKTLLEKILPQNSYFDGFEVHHKFSRIGEKIMLLNARRIVLENHKTRYILLAIEDVTERKLLEKRKDEFLAMASHELKTPITVIKVYTQILKKRLSLSRDKKDIYFLSQIESQTDKITNLINDLLDVTKIEAGKLAFSKKKFDLDALIKKIVVDFQYVSDTHQIIKAGEANKNIMGDEDRIGQVLINLLTNAIKYSPDADQIIVKVSENKKEVIIGVQDFGMGIPGNKQTQIFGRYFRISKKEEETIKGSGFKSSSGLGLYISAEIITRHGGKIWVESGKGKGATFYFTLPLSK